ncbi:MAG TPA: hypothetical protein VF603_07065 [Allosphingosinicella sp.]|jgi:ppGpp synthetase/RelA/SpoT-type nucleotidyltranferase
MVDSVNAALADVDRFLEQKGPDYERFLEDVLRELARYRERRKNSSVVYRVYSRADKQARGERLKSRLGIATKLAEWREKNSRCKVSEIHDIIGITVVVYFEKEIPIFCHGLTDMRSDVFEIVSDELISKDDYNARHIIVGKRVGAARERLSVKLLCEIQVKSLLHDGWATRTHDLTYKTKERKDPRIEEQVSALTKLVKSLEEQSDVLRSYIVKDDEDDEVRRDGAVSQLFFQTTQRPATETESEISDMASALLGGRDYFAKCPENDPLLVALLDRWKRVNSTTGECRVVSRFMVLLALVRTARDFDSEAIETIESWIERSTSNEERAGALTYKALALWALGDLARAIDAARVAVRYLDDNGLKSRKFRANLAYYVAEHFFISKNAAAGASAPEVEDFLKMRFTGEDERNRMSILDTRGAVLIMTATDAEQVWQGQRLCDKARKWAQKHGEDKAVFELFYELHERRARRRLSELR